VGAAAAEQGNVRMLVDCEVIPKEKKESLSRLTSSGHLQGLVHHHPYCWTLQMIRLQLNGKCLLFKLWFVVKCDSFHNFS
jgi:hypothetical protein